MWTGLAASCLFWSALAVSDLSTVADFPEVENDGSKPSHDNVQVDTVPYVTPGLSSSPSPSRHPIVDFGGERLIGDDELPSADAAAANHPLPPFCRGDTGRCRVVDTRLKAPTTIRKRYYTAFELIIPKLPRELEG